MSRTSSSVTVVDRLPAFRLGLANALSGAFDRVEEREEPGDAVGLVVVAARSEDECAAARRLCARPDAVVVVVLARPLPGDYADALRWGAAAVAADDERPEEIVQVAVAAAAGRVRLPAAVARALALRAPARVDRDALTGAELLWLRALARGVTVAQLAERARYSERECYRRLATLYGKLGASNRAEALVTAARAGLLD